MKNKICPKCDTCIKWDGLGWRCDNCGYVIEPTPEEVREAVMEQSPLSCKRVEGLFAGLHLPLPSYQYCDLVYEIMLMIREADHQRSS